MDITLSKRHRSKMRYRYFVHFRHDISVFANFSHGITVLSTPNVPLLDPCCEPYAQPLPWLSSLDQSKRGIGWATAHYKVIRWLLSLARGGQSVITYFFVDKLSELQISLVGELSSAITLILMRRAGNSHSVETSETDSGHGRVAG